MANCNDNKELRKQYENAGNLNSRMLLHQLFSTNKQGWSNWVFQNYRLEAGQLILELGCGNGSFWAANAHKLPDNIRLILSDFSEGMLGAAKENASKIKNIEYKVIDAQAIPFEDNLFDIVIANHMLYHVPDLNRALKEIARVLKDGGTFYATTIGVNNTIEIVDILHDFDPSIDFAHGEITRAFSLENGREKLEKYFGSIELRRYADSLHITRAQPLIDYILSSQGIGNVNEIIRGEKIEQFSGYISGLFSKTGYIDIQKDAGIFISSKVAHKEV